MKTKLLLWQISKWKWLLLTKMFYIWKEDLKAVLDLNPTFPKQPWSQRIWPCPTARKPRREDGPKQSMIQPAQLRSSRWQKQHFLPSPVHLQRQFTEKWSPVGESSRRAFNIFCSWTYQVLLFKVHWVKYYLFFTISSGKSVPIVKTKSKLGRQMEDCKQQ